MVSEIICDDCLDVMRGMDDCSIDLTITSPPYEALRKYHGQAPFTFDTFKPMARELYRITKNGGVVVWVIGDQTVNGSESGSSFRQALYFMECGFRLHDTMIYHKTGLTMNHNRYEQEFEYMFILSKGKPKTFNPIRIPTKYPEKPTARQASRFSETDEKMRRARSGKKRKPVGKDKIKGNVWYYPTGKNHSTKDDFAFEHPAIFPEQLAADHIASWSNPGDLILDPFCGSGTVGKMAALAGRDFIGIDIDPQYCELSRRRIATVMP